MVVYVRIMVPGVVMVKRSDQSEVCVDLRVVFEQTRRLYPRQQYEEVMLIVDHVIRYALPIAEYMRSSHVHVSQKEGLEAGEEIPFVHIYLLICFTTRKRWG